MDFNQLAGTIESLLLKQKGIDGYEITIGSSRNLSIEVKEQKVDTFKCSAPLGVSLRILKNRGLGFSFSTSLDQPDLERMIGNAVVAAENQTPDDCNGLALPAPYPAVAGMLDETLATVPEEEKIGRAIELERLTLAADERVRKVRKSSYGESIYEVFIRNSAGIEGRYRGSMVSSSVSAIAQQGEDSQMGWDFGFSSAFAGVDVAMVAATAARKAAGLLGARKIATMRCPVVLDQHVAGEMLEILAPSFLGENVLKGKSILAGKVGDRPFAPLVRIRDDGTLPGGMSTTPFDGEGVPQQNTVLVEDGVVRGFLYDTFYGRKAKAASTGNASRGGIKSPPHMGVSNFFIEPGSSSVSELCSGIGRGVLVTEVMGMHTANPVSGDFSVGAAGYLIEGGIVTAPVKGIALAGNIIELFADVEAVGNDLRFFGDVGAPSLRIGSLDVSGE